MSNPYSDPFGGQGTNPYGAPGYQSYGQPKGGHYRPHRGPLILTLGIISLVLSTVGTALCGLFPIVGLALAIPAWILGQGDLKAIDRGEMDPQGRGVTQAGMITGIIGTVIGILTGIIAVVILLLFLGFIAIGAAGAK